jgi:hypothetical protein
MTRHRNAHRLKFACAQRVGGQSALNANSQFIPQVNLPQPQNCVSTINWAQIMEFAQYQQMSASQQVNGGQVFNNNVQQFPPQNVKQPMTNNMLSTLPQPFSNSLQPEMATMDDVQHVDYNFHSSKSNNDHLDVAMDFPATAIINDVGEVSIPPTTTPDTPTIQDNMATTAVITPNNSNPSCVKEPLVSSILTNECIETSVDPVESNLTVPDNHTNGANETPQMDNNAESDTPSPVQIVPGQIYITTEGIMFQRVHAEIGDKFIYDGKALTKCSEEDNSKKLIIQGNFSFKFE